MMLPRWTPRPWRPRWSADQGRQCHVPAWRGAPPRQPPLGARQLPWRGPSGQPSWPPSRWRPLLHQHHL
eukprot:632481-Pyramimonas_sp.AAC.1